MIKVGDDCGFSGTSIGIKESLLVGNNVQVGANTYITDFDWHSMDPADRDNSDKIAARGIVIEDNVWLGLNCIVLKGVSIGENSIVGAGSVVTKDIPANVICAGNPCKVIKNIEPKTGTVAQLSSTDPGSREERIETPVTR
ncbi:MAG: acyltransferase [Acidobacteriota bacterium]